MKRQPLRASRCLGRWCRVTAWCARLRRVAAAAGRPRMTSSLLMQACCRPPRRVERAPVRDLPGVNCNWFLTGC